MEKKKIYTVATAHLDTIWSWDFETTVSKYIYNTLVDNFALFKKYPHYTFNFEGSYRYELMEEYYPELFNEMKGYIESGRWNVCGSSFENGDMNVPSPEALFRNILFGNSYFDKKFGKRSVDIYLPDCFGFGWALPSVAAHAHLMGFTTQKLAWGSAYGVPFDIGVWKGVDGAEIYASVNPHDYYFTLKKLRDWDFVQKKLKENEKYGLDMTYIFHGIGDRGGAPKEASVAFVESEIEKNANSDIEVLASSADQIYHDIDEGFTDEQKAKLPRWETELVMQNHGVGGYTSRAIGKRWNKRCEELADMAERAGVIADYLGTAEYNKTALTRNWKRFIAHQFHDDLPGTSVQRAYRRSWNDYAMSMNGFASELEASSASVGSLLKTDFCTGIPVVVSNSIEHRRSGAVTLHLKDVKLPYVRVYDQKGREIKSQVNYVKDGITEVVFIADVPSLGFRVYDVRPSDTPCMLKGNVSISSENVMENQKYIVRLNKKGNISSIVDKDMNEQELLAEPISLGLFKYKGSRAWPAWEMNFKEANKDPDRIPNIVTITVEETGPARVAFRVEQKDKKSNFVSIIALTDGSEYVEVYSEIEWRSLRTMAKNKFAFKCSNEKATFDLGLGAIQRENMNEKLFEVPAQKWADITDSDEKWGVSVFSECKNGWDKYKDNTLRMTVVHTPKGNYRIDSMQSMMDLGLNRYSYAVYSHKGKVGADTQLQARFFTQPMTGYVETKHQGVLGSEYSFGGVSDKAVIMRACKKAEDSDEIVVRLNEGANSSVERFELTLGEGIESAREIYASEEPKGEACIENGKLVTSFKPYGIKSFALKLKPSAVLGKKTVSRPVSLPADCKIITAQGENSSMPYNIPKEIIKDSVDAAGLHFDIKRDGENALICAGQTIRLSSDAEQLALLIASDSDKELEFLVDDDSVVKQVFSMTERFAGWDLYDFGETAYIKKAKLGYEATHSHDEAGKDIYAKGLYFYILTLDVKGKKTVMLPVDEQTVVLSASEVINPHGTLATPVYDEVEKRPFTYSMNFGEKMSYIWGRMIWNMRDLEGYFKCINKGKHE